MYMRVKYLVALLLVLVAVACTKDDLYGDYYVKAESAADDVVELCFGVPETRATLDESLNLRWQKGDRITVMAYDGSTQIFAKEAGFWANLTSNTESGGYSQAFFKATFNTTSDSGALNAIENLASGKCYAVSPVGGVTISGTSATMTIRSVQNGEYNSAYDFMTARSGAISELRLSDGQNEDFVNNIDLEFQHHTHAFRVRIPGNALGKEITKAYLKFPFKVVGDMSVDYTSGAVTSTPTSDLVTVEFTEPKTAGDEFWVFIAGVDNKGKVDIRFQAEDGTFTERRIANFTQQNWSAGKISKVSMSVPQATTLKTVKYTVTDWEQLGEPVEKLHMTLPDGYYFTNYKQTTDVAAVNGVYEFTVFSDMVDSTLTNGELTMKFDSAHALVPAKVTFADASLKAPYLFEEDFSSIESYSRDIETGAQDTACDAYDLSESTYGLSPGWTGARTGGEEGKSIRVGSRVDQVYGMTHTYGRLDSPALKAIKDNTQVTIQVSFNYSGGRNGKTEYSPRAVFGYSSVTGPINGTSGSFTSDADNWNELYGYQVVPSISVSGSYTSITQTMTHTIPDCANNYRLSWQIRGTGKLTGLVQIGNGNQWMFIDNIKVSIVQ